MKRFALFVLITAVVIPGCSSTMSSSPSAAPETTGETMKPATTIAPTSTSTTSTLPPTTVPGPTFITCDTEDPEPVIHDAPLGTEIVLIAKSSTEREFHLHGYDLELTGQEVTFQFTASLPGDHELTEHPDHTTVCIISS